MKWAIQCFLWMTRAMAFSRTLEKSMPFFHRKKSKKSLQSIQCHQLTKKKSPITALAARGFFGFSP
jgi:hypothetical protein